ncbi:MAG: hypothetical protein NUV80_07545 [Candidatus Berkelbacteria bacterium]|nr:hypothetical protein [Candidatus Berkelbacteria bacterium]
MANINLYSTLAEYKAFVTARGQTASTDTADDGVIVDLLEVASRFLDSKTARHYYPTIETRLYDFPETRDMNLKADLLEVITLTNGDSTSIPSTDYVLDAANETPYWNLRLRSNGSTYWTLNSTNGIEQIIQLYAWFGYREQYAQRAWALAGTLGAAITDTTTLAFTMTAGHSLAVGQVIKIGTEIYNITTVATNTITPIARGDNGSTAATHLNGVSVYTWKPQEQAKNAVLEIANTAYNRRFGKNTGTNEQITAAGIVLSPRDIPAMASEFIQTYKRIIL